MSVDQFYKISQNCGSSCAKVMALGPKNQLNKLMKSIFFYTFPKNLLSQFSQRYQPSLFNREAHYYILTPKFGNLTFVNCGHLKIFILLPDLKIW